MHQRPFNTIIILIGFLFSGAGISAGDVEVIRQGEGLTYRISDEQQKKIIDISTTEDSDTFNILIQGNYVLSYSPVQEFAPPGLAIYFPETGLDLIDKELWFDSHILRSLEASELLADGPSKILISLKKPSPYTISQDQTGLTVSFLKQFDDPGLNAAPQEDTSGPRMITVIDTAEEVDSVSVLIKGNRTLTYTSIQQPSRLILLFPETGLATYTRDLTVNSEIIESVKAMEPDETGGPSRIIISLKKKARYDIRRDGTTQKIVFKR